MRPVRLRTLLTAVNAGLLLVAILGVAGAALLHLRRLSDDEAKARVLQAGRTAREVVAREADEAESDALLLAERPTLLRLLREGDPEGAIHAFLDRFRETSQHDGAAVIAGGRVLASTGVSLPWEGLVPSTPSEEGRFLRELPGDTVPGLVLGAWALLPEDAGQTVIVARVLDEAFAADTSAEVGMRFALSGRGRALADPADPRAPLRARVLSTGEPVAERIGPLASYIAVTPLCASTEPHCAEGNRTALIETELPASGVVASLRWVGGRFLAIAILAVALAVLTGLALGGWLVRPLEALTASAARIGRGDLATPVPPAPGAEIGTLAATLEEMRERLTALTADLRMQKAESDAVLTGIQEGVFTVDRERRIRYLNPQAAAMLGVFAQDVAGRFCGDVLNPRGPGGIRPCEKDCPILHARFRGASRATENLILPGDRRRTVVITSTPPTDGLQYQVMREETEVEAGRRLRDSMLANISHEFRTPLTAQLASIELLRDELGDRAGGHAKELLASLQRGTLRLTHLIDNLLESARIEAGHEEVRHRPVALDEVVEEAIEMTLPLIQQRRQEVAVELPYPMPPVHGDSPRLVQVFVNLLGNATKFAPEGSTIRVGGAVEADSVTLWVEDEGPGIEGLRDSVLFGPFVRSRGEEPEAGGAGLGLAIVKSIVERHGGSVEARSAGGGTRMCVTLPREAAR